MNKSEYDKGYTKENIIVVSNRANRLKQDSTQQERELLTEFYRTR